MGKSYGFCFFSIAYIACMRKWVAWPFHNQCSSYSHTYRLYIVEYLHKWVSQKPQPNRLSINASMLLLWKRKTDYNYSPFDSTFGVMGMGQAWASLTCTCELNGRWLLYFMVGLINCSLALQAVTHTPCRKEMVSRMQSYVYSVSGSQQNLWHWDFVASIWYSNIRPRYIIL